MFNHFQRTPDSSCVLYPSQDSGGGSPIIDNQSLTDTRTHILVSGHPRITWLNTVRRDLRTYNLTLNKAVDLAQNRPLWSLMSMYGTTHS